MFRQMAAGESHSEALTVVLEGVSAGVRITSEDIQAALVRRRLGHGHGARQAFERDELRVLGGVRYGSIIGSPVALQIVDSEWPKWSTVMSANSVAPHDLLIGAGTGDGREIARNRPLTRPRPGHVDLPGMLRHDLSGARLALERASARKTVVRVALGAVAETLLEQVAGIRLVNHVVRIESVVLPDDVPPPRAEDAERLSVNPVRCTDPAISTAMVAKVNATRKDGGTFGDAIEIIATGVPMGLGTYVSADRRLNTRLTTAFMGIQVIKGAEIGDGFVKTAWWGSAAHDEIVSVGCGRLTRSTNCVGGIEGGISNGLDVRVQAAFKPISMVPRALRTVDLATDEPAAEPCQRSNVCAVVPGAVTVQAITAPVLTSLLLSKTGGDSVDEVRRSLRSHLGRIAEQTQWRTGR